VVGMLVPAQAHDLSRHVGLRSKIEMFRLDARDRVAAMQNLLARGNAPPDGLFVGKTAHGLIPPVPPHAPLSIGRDQAVPKQTSARRPARVEGELPFQRPAPRAHGFLCTSSHGRAPTGFRFPSQECAPQPPPPADSSQRRLEPVTYHDSGRSCAALRNCGRLATTVARNGHRNAGVPGVQTKNSPSPHRG
jgi:hypothetical protein